MRKKHFFVDSGKKSWLKDIVRFIVDITIGGTIYQQIGANLLSNFQITWRFLITTPGTNTCLNSIRKTSKNLQGRCSSVPSDRRVISLLVLSEFENKF